MTGRSDPSSEKYGQYYTQEQVNDLFAPSTESVEAIRNWVSKSADIPVDRITQSHNKQWVMFEVPVSKLEQLLRTKYQVYEHRESGKRSIGTEKLVLKIFDL